MRSKFKDEHSFEKRKAEADRIRTNDNGHIPACPTPDNHTVFFNLAVVAIATSNIAVATWACNRLKDNPFADATATELASNSAINLNESHTGMKDALHHSTSNISVATWACNRLKYNPVMIATDTEFARSGDPLCMS